MFSRIPRRTWLTVLAAGNLVFWVAVAVIVGLLATDAVDLGVESLARQYQATSVAAWQRVIGDGSAINPGPTLVAGVPQPTALPGVTAEPGGIVPVSEGGEAPGIPGAGVEGTSEPGVEQGSTGQEPPDPVPTAQPVQTLVSRVLLIADPALEESAELTTEMNRSAVGRPIQITFREDALNREVEALLKTRDDLPFDNVQFELSRDKVSATGSSTVLGLRVGTEVDGTVVAENCLPRLEIGNVSVAGVLAPAFFAKLIREMLVDAMDWYPSQSPLCLEQIILEEGRITIYAHRR